MSADTKIRVMSGWCMDGHHRAGWECVGCKQDFPSFTCSCPCHDEDRSDDPSFAGPTAPQHVQELDAELEEEEPDQEPQAELAAH